MSLTGCRVTDLQTGKRGIVQRVLEFRNDGDDKYEVVFGRNRKRRKRKSTEAIFANSHRYRFTRPVRSPKPVYRKRP